MDRLPVVAGQFYSNDPDALKQDIASCMSTAEGKMPEHTVLAMVPHAGYPFSGGVCGKTMGEANFASRVILLGPNHTGNGRPLAVWPDGVWRIPGGEVPVDEMLAARVIACHTALEADTVAHAYEHSLEVVLPFLRTVRPDAGIVPICVAESNLDVLRAVAGSIAATLKQDPKPASIVVSSDMSHFLSDVETRKLDTSALNAAVALDAEALYHEVLSKDISMCGILPMTLGLFLARELGATSARLVAYSTSGDVTGDYSKVVGYAGILAS